MANSTKELLEIKRRRTFAVVSHPDAGKTTITEQFLLAGGVIREAGNVKAKANKKFATSDWMEIERKRGISVTSSVLSFPYEDAQVNLVDTPGHEDFCEDTYRALTAVDSVLVLLDAAKGVEPQTIKLMEVCRLRKTPVMVFVNKMDREAKNPIEIMDDVEKILGVACAPYSLPIGQGQTFVGTYGIVDQKLRLFKFHGEEEQNFQIFTDPTELKNHPEITEYQYGAFAESFDLASGVMDSFSLPKYLAGEQAPVFFGSAINGFGIHHILSEMVKIAPSPLPRKTTQGEYSPTENGFSGYVFKIQANMDAKHRDRIAYLRVCSGSLLRGDKVYHVRLDRQIKLATPSQFIAQEKSIVEVVYAGDIVGIHDPGYFNIGDTLTEGPKFYFEGIPDFPSEYFQRVVLEDPLTGKKLSKGLHQLSEEGAVQLFLPQDHPNPILGVVGMLQFDVIRFRLESEYGAKCRMEPVSVWSARWLVGEKAKVEQFVRENKHDCAKDKKGNDVYLCPNEFRLKKIEESYEDIKFEAIHRG